MLNVVFCTSLLNAKIGMPFSSTSMPRNFVHVCRLRPATVNAALSARKKFFDTTCGSVQLADNSRNRQYCNGSVYATAVVTCPPVNGPTDAIAPACRSSGESTVDTSTHERGVFAHWNARFVLTRSP